MDTDVTVNDPEYVVRRRLGQKLSGSDPRQDQIDNMGAFGGEINENVKQEIRQDYKSEIEDALSDMEDQMDRMSEKLMQNDFENPEQEGEDKIDQYMRVSSLQLAFRGYPIFKSIVVN